MPPAEKLLRVYSKTQIVPLAADAHSIEAGQLFEWIRHRWGRCICELIRRKNIYTISMLIFMVSEAAALMESYPRVLGGFD